MTEILLVLLAYLCGSIPFAYLIARARGVDIFTVGTGNPGAANVFRSVGRGAGILALACDLLKGALPVAAAQLAGASHWWAYAAGLAALVGHWYPLFLRFRGGAGLATTIGVGFALMPLPALVGALPAAAFLAWKRNTGNAAGIGFAVFFVAALLLRQPVPLALAIAILPALALLRDRVLPKVGAGR